MQFFKRSKQLVWWKRAFKIVFGALALSSVMWELGAVISLGTFDPTRFFAYFTIQVNMLVGISLLLSAFKKPSSTLDSLRGAVLVYIVIVGIVFSALLAGLENATLTVVPWNNAVLHYIMPIAVLADYFIDRPMRLRMRRALVWLLYPMAYLGLTMARGALDGWYPYPFLDATVGGTANVLAIIFGIFGMTLVLAAAVARGGRHVSWFERRM